MPPLFAPHKAAIRMMVDGGKQIIIGGSALIFYTAALPLAIWYRRHPSQRHEYDVEIIKTRGDNQ